MEGLLKKVTFIWGCERCVGVTSARKRGQEEDLRTERMGDLPEAKENKEFSRNWENKQTKKSKQNKKPARMIDHRLMRHEVVEKVWGKVKPHWPI